MSFLQANSNYQFSTEQTSLKKYFLGRFTPNNSRDSSISSNHTATIPVKRMSLFSPAGSMTIEAAMILPIFLFFFMNLLSVIEMMRLHSTMTMALREVGSELAMYAYAYEKLEEGEESELADALKSISFSYLYIRNKVIEYAGKEYLKHSPLMGAENLTFWDAHIMEEEDTIELLLVYKVSPPFSAAGFADSRMFNSYYIRAWTGYDVAGEREEESSYVYVTETGGVYHVSKQCTHLLLRIREADMWDIPVIRNAYQETYTACLLCGNETGIKIYVTMEGNRYHKSLQCSGLKRTVIPILKSKSEGYRSCKRCAG